MSQCRGCAHRRGRRLAAQVGSDPDVHPAPAANWVRQAAVDARKRPAGAPTADKQADLAALHERDRVLEQRRDVLQQEATASPPARTREIAFIEHERARIHEARGRHRQASTAVAPRGGSRSRRARRADLLPRDVSSEAPHRSWATDVTSLRQPNGHVDVAGMVIDLVSRDVVGWWVSAPHDTNLWETGPGAAVRRSRPDRVPLQPCDQGSTWTRERQPKLLDDDGAICSVGRRGSCCGNAAVESSLCPFKAEVPEHDRGVAHIFPNVVDAWR
jgi:transposase InsO family protein